VLTLHTSDEGIGSRLERAKAVTNDEDGEAEATKGAVQDAWNRDDGSKGV
jgi:hypothetical protein